MIEVVGLKKSFNDREVLKGIDVRFKKGVTNLIIGQSGSGKTVFLKSLLGLHRINEGKILFDKTDLTALDPKAERELRMEMGMVFQNSALFDSLTVMDNVLFPLNMFSTMSEAEKRDRAQFCLERVNLPEAGHLFPAEISGGMKKRVAIARAIVMNPKYLFCDEPNSGLDPKTSILIDNLIQEITEEFQTTTIVNTHDMNSVMEIGDHIILISEGMKGWEGSKDEILTTDHPAIVDFVFTSKLFRAIRKSHTS